MENLKNDDTEMKTLVSCTNMLDGLGFKTQFKAQKKGLESLTTKRIYMPEEVKVVNYYRFEGASNPSDNSILYAIETNNGERGTLTDAYGAYSEPEVANFIKAVESLEKKVNKKDSL